MKAPAKAPAPAARRVAISSIRGLAGWRADQEKANLVAHGVSLNEASTVFGDPRARIVAAQGRAATEISWVATGISEPGRLLIVTYRRGLEGIVMTAARPATRRERSAHEAWLEDMDPTAQSV
ncbi:MAG TPA: BrnT family toxin [Candidatus Limnocylindrales bacterium]|nr:BrnT family toxin [Candidatus Limnocylindrales bacterium]